MRKYNINSIYNRQLWSYQYYGKQSHIEVSLGNGKIMYLYFDKDKHIRFTNNEKYATHFGIKPRNYDQYVSYIKRKYPSAIVNYVEKVVIKNKY